MPTPPSPYSVQPLLSIERTITRERSTRYLGATGQDLPRALRLYEYNAQLSEALYGLLHVLEVSLRNAAHHALAASFGAPNWYDKVKLNRYWMEKINSAKAAIGPGTPGKVIAELTFGFWVDLHAFLTLPAIAECVEWICSVTAYWMNTQFRFAD